MKIFLGLIFLGISVMSTYAQDGSQLFKAKCNTCHAVDKNSTGPLLKGAKQKWNDAGEGELIYEWVKNPQSLIASGKSSMAAKVNTFSSSDMTPQAVTNEEIDAILDYVDNYSPPAPPTTSEKPIETVNAGPDYNENLTLFYWFLTAIIIQLIAIIVISSSISTFVRSDFFKKKIKENEGRIAGKLKTLVVILGIFTFSAISNKTLALTFYQNGEAPEGLPWLRVENQDLYLMIAINLVLLFVILYLKRMFRIFLEMAVPAKVKEVPANQGIKKLNKVLTDAVAIEEEHTILLHHEYDGIRELDNNLPPWWLWGFYATIVFSVIYMINYHVLQTGDSQLEEYNKEMVQAKIDIASYLSEQAMNVDETNATLLTDGNSVSSGKALFESNCTACHNPKAEGNIGPNLTDKFWIYGPDVKDVFKTIKLGTPNGMPEHASKLNPIQLQQVSSFILSLPFTKGKEPQGKKYK